MKMPRPARRVYRTLRPGWGSRGGSCWRAIRQGIANWKLIEADERWEQVTVAAPRLVNSNIGSKDFPMPQKTHSEGSRAAASWLRAASWASNSVGESNRAPSADVCGSRSFPSRLTTVTPVGNRQGRNFPSYRNFAYSASASFRIGISGSASFQRVKSSRYAAPLLSTSPSKA
jgi:hypothetical protein